MKGETDIAVCLIAVCLKAAVRLALAEAMVPQIATFTGHSLKDLEAILTTSAATFSLLKQGC